MRDIYPGPRNPTEFQRLQAQHALAKSALGGPLVPQQYLNLPNVRILDSGTADGYWLSQIRQELAHPDSATLIGTDIADPTEQKRSYDLPSNIQFQQQDVHKEWPAQWKGTFHVVHQRAVMASTQTMDKTTAVVQRLLELVKPGGCLVMVDSVMLPGEIHENDSACQKLYKACGIMIASHGMDSTLGAKLDHIITEAIKNSGLRFGQLHPVSAPARIGINAESGLEEVGYTWIRGMNTVLGPALKNMGDKALIPGDQIDGIFDDWMKEARTDGPVLPWYGVTVERMV